MSELVIIRPTRNEEELEKQKNDYESLPYDFRRLSNDEALKKYGKTNDQIYDICRNSIDKNEDVDDIETIVKESVGLDTDSGKNAFLDIINKAKSIESSGGVIIYPIDINYSVGYTLDELERKWQQYNNLNQDLQRLSDQESISLFGNDIKYMYTSNKNKIVSGEKDSQIDNIEVTDIEGYVKEVKENCISGSDPIEKQLRLLDMTAISKNGSLLESAITEKSIDSIKETECKLSDLMPNIVPYLTPTELLEYVSEDDEFYLEYSNACRSGLYGFNYNAQWDEIKKLSYEYNNGNLDAEDELLRKGWNPSVPANEKALKQAKQRVAAYIDSMDPQIIDISNMEIHEDFSHEIPNNDNLSPIFIVLQYNGSTMGKLINKVKKSNYSHAAIGFEESLNNLYSFTFNIKNPDAPGLTFESIAKYIKDGKVDARIKVIALFVTRNQKERIVARLNYFIDNKEKTRYDIRNLGRILFNKKCDSNYSLKMVCSEFVDFLLRAANIDITSKSNNLVSPVDFEKAINPKLYCVYEGLAKKYNKKKVRVLIKAIMTDRTSLYQVMDLEEARNIMFEHRDPMLYKVIKCSDPAGNKIIDEINNLLTAESVLTEASFPISFNKKGDLEVSIPIVLEDEYQKSHKLLTEYEKTNSYNSMKDEISKLWYMNNIIEKKLKKKKDKEELIKLRARILNDFKKYLNIILNKNPDFNFMDYFMKSKYYDKSIKINNDTLIWSGKVLKTIITK